MARHVLAHDDAERARKGETRAHLALLVARRGEGGGHLGGRRRGHLLSTRDQDEVVEAERDGEDAVAERDAPRGAGALHLRGRDAPQPEPAGQEGGQRALAREPLADEVADVERLDLPARDARVGEGLAARGDGELDEPRALHPTERGGADADDRHLSHGRPPPLLVYPRQGSGGPDGRGPAPDAPAPGAPSRPPGAPAPGPVRSRRTSSA